MFRQSGDLEQTGDWSCTLEEFNMARPKSEWARSRSGIWNLIPSNLHHLYIADFRLSSGRRRGFPFCYFCILAAEMVVSSREEISEEQRQEDHMSSR